MAILAEPATTTRRFNDAPAPAPRRQVRPRVPLAIRGIVFAAAVGLVLIYALRGGSYDIVAFEEYGLVIWVALAGALALGLLPRSRPALPVLVLLGALLAYSAWIALSLTWTESSERTFAELARSLDYLGLATLIAFATGQGTWRPALAGLGTGGMIVCVLAVGSRLFPSAFPDDGVSSAAHFYRLSYPFGYWNAVAAWGAMCTAFGLVWSAHADRRLVRALALALVPVAYLMTYLSYSRAGIAGTAVAGTAAVLLSRNRLTALLNTAIAAGGSVIAVFAVRGAPDIANATGTRGLDGAIGGIVLGAAVCALGAVATGALNADRPRVPRSVALSGAAVLAVVLAIAGAALGPRLASRAWHSFTRPAVVTQTNDPTQRLLNFSGSRYDVWKVAVRAFRHEPLTGTGAGTFEFWFNQHGGDAEFALDAHSLWFQNMAELGAPGLLLIIAVAVSALWTLVAVRRRARRAASAGAAAAGLALFVVYLVHASVDWMWQSTAITALALAVTAATGARLSRRVGRLQAPVRGGLAVGALVCAAVQLPGLLSTTEIRRSQSAERRGNPSLALAWANDAVSAEPWSASASEQRGLVLEAAGRYASAAQDIRHAVSEEPTNFVHWIVLARIDTERGQLNAAVADYRRAHMLRPHSPLFVPPQ